MTTHPSAAVRADLLRRAVARHPTIAMMSALADVLFELDALDEAAHWFREAYLSSPDIQLLNWLDTMPPDNVVSRAESLIARDAGFSPVIAALAIGRARLGRRAETASLVDYERLLTVRQLPSRIASSDAFRRELVTEILSDLTPYDVPAKRAIRHAQRNDHLLSSTTPVATEFRVALETAVREYVAELPDDPGHPFIRSRPASWILEGWAVISDERSFHHSHIHARAWMSGVCYLVRPPVSLDSSTKTGWLRVGPPSHLGVGTETGWPERWIAPEVGSVVLMPAYFFHETLPLQASEQRICVAFDVVPREIADRTPDDHGAM